MELNGGSTLYSMINADSEKRRKTLIRVHLSTSSEAERSVVTQYYTVAEYSTEYTECIPLIDNRRTNEGLLDLGTWDLGLGTWDTWHMTHDTSYEGFVHRDTHAVDETALLAIPFQHSPWLIMAKTTAQSKPMPSSMCSMRVALGISLFRCTGQVFVMFRGQGNAPLFAIDNLPYNMKEALLLKPQFTHRTEPTCQSDNGTVV